MIEAQRILSVSTLLGAIGLWLLLPRGRGQGRALGTVLALAGFGGWLSQLPGVGDWLSSGLFYVLAGATVISAVATVTFRSPVYCAIWFGMMLAGTAGLFLMAGAEFLAVATIVVYAGAILVTFLFVLMLCQPEGHTAYDRRSWEPMLAAFTGAVIVGVLSMTIAGVVSTAVRVEAGGKAEGKTAAFAQPAPLGPAAKTGDRSRLAGNHVAELGAELFTRHLVAVEGVGVLLFAALVGAAAIIANGRADRR